MGGERLGRAAVEAEVEVEEWNQAAHFGEITTHDIMTRGVNITLRLCLLLCSVFGVVISI